MKILVPETTSLMGAQVAESARAIGHSVYSCHLPELLDDRCRAAMGWTCPIDTEDIDAAVLCGTGGGDTLTCARRHRIPVALVLSPGRASVRAAIADATGYLEGHSRVAEAAASHALRSRGIDAGSRAVVKRHDGGLAVELRLPPVDDPTANAVAIVVHDALRGFDHWATSIDITVPRSAA